MGEAWSEIFFGVEGPNDERVRIEVFHADNVAKVHPAIPEQWFSVSGSTLGPVKTVSTHGKKVVSGWAENVEDENIRRVFLHIEEHRAITETEVTKMLGSPRAFRRFSLDFETHLAKLPFRIRIESAEGGKRYVREDEK